jgi:hypothetical protein
VNPVVFLLLAGAVAAVAVSSQSSKPVDEEDDLLASSQKMVLLFDLYTAQRRVDLSDDELYALARLNAEAKGITLIDREGVLSIAKVKIASQSLDTFGKVQGMEIPEAVSYYRQAFFLPPGVAKSHDGADDAGRSAPDIYSIWAGETRLVCEDGGFGDACHKGYFQDWFGRSYGAYHDNDSDFEVISSGFLDQLKTVWNAAGSQLLSYIASMASNFPGIGTAVSVGITFVSEVGKGVSLKNAALTSARAAVPSALRSAYDIGVGLATSGKIDIEAALTIAMAAAISQGAIDGEVLAKYNTIKKAYEDAKATGEQLEGGLGSLGTAVDIAI